MLSCIACSKQLDDAGDDVARSGTPNTKDPVKSLTSQIKDLALKCSGGYRQSKPGTASSSSSNYRKGRSFAYGDMDTISEGPGHPYLGAGSSSSTPAWDFPTINRDHPSVALSSGSRFRDISRGEQTLQGPESVSGQSGEMVFVEEEEPKEWMAQVEPGVHITFLSLPQGGNDLKRIRFSREMFNKWQAQRWWGENFDRIMELYNVQRFNRQALPTPPRSEDERDSYSQVASTRESPATPSLSKDRQHRNFYRSPGGNSWEPTGYSHHVSATGAKVESAYMDASRTTTSSRDENSVSISNASDQENEWVEQDEPGVYITIRALPDGTRELRRVRFRILGAILLVAGLYSVVWGNYKQYQEKQALAIPEAGKGAEETGVIGYIDDIEANHIDVEKARAKKDDFDGTHLCPYSYNPCGRAADEG